MIEKIVSAAIKIKSEKETLDALKEARAKKVAERDACIQAVSEMDKKIAQQEALLQEAVTAIKEWL